eukprot:1089494-Prymnesium_polylepis.2
MRVRRGRERRSPEGEAGKRACARILHPINDCARPPRHGNAPRKRHREKTKPSHSDLCTHAQSRTRLQLYDNSHRVRDNKLTPVTVQ